MLYLISHPIQYFSPLFKQLALKIPLCVGYMSKVGLGEGKDAGFGQNIVWDEPLLEGYKYFFLENRTNSESIDNGFWDVFNPSIFYVLYKSKEKIVVVNGWSYSTNWLVFILCKLLRKKVWLRAESPLNQELSKSKKILLIKKIILKQILFKFFINKFLYIGTQNKAFYSFYGVNNSQLIYTPYAVDNAKFRAKYLANKSNLKDIRKSLDIPEHLKIILFSGKYIVKKRPLDLLQAFQKLSGEGYGLIFLGDGMLRAEMESFVSNNNIENVWLTGFINQSQIDKYYSIAAVFVMTSGIGETWGLSVNEAMNFNLPVIVSQTCGSSYDLVEEGGNGFTFKEGDIEGLTRAIRAVFAAKQLEKMGNRSYEIVQNFTIEKSVTNIYEAVKSSLND